ncbi:GLUG motif-containing protein [Halorubrum ezzemoulense]|uniref:GLUG motif-containing protein n=1 Tax=Halorubrum ezzemoulense TaxID=337243 RepID=UPI00232E5651|nr:GLUG motif-containing protein [Halorubrum ezzemoulense]MDB2265342.1 GLUG motif-containing protein [Halorubrum ezzemoulense]
MSGDEIALDFDTSDGGGSGVGLNSTYNFDDVFTIENQGTQTIYVWANFSGEDLDDDDIWFYPGSDSGRRLNDGSNSVVTLTTGQQVNVGVHIDTSVLSSTGDQGLTATLTADVDVPGGEDDSQPSDPVGEDAAVVSKDPDVGEFNSIQDAIDDVDGTTVLVEPGTYDESVTIDVEGLTLEAAEGASPTIAPGDDTDAITVTANNVAIDGFGTEIGVTDGEATAVDLSGLSSSDSVTIENTSFDADGAEGETYVFDPNGAVDLDAVLNDQGNEFDPDAVAFDGQIIPSAVAPTLIEDWNDLDDVRFNIGGDFALVSDLDKNTAGYSDVVDPDGTGFDPILFEGTFDGNGHVIEDLVIDQDGQAGLFGQLAGPTEITNLGLENVDVSGGDQVGALLGATLADATISESYATGTVEGEKRVGGLVGLLQPGTISDSFASVEVTGNTSGTSVGGLVGANNALPSSDGIVERSYATGDVTNNYDGDDYSAGAGGLVGKNDGSTIIESYATGSVEVVSENLPSQGGLAADNTNGDISDSYWDTETTGQTEAAQSGFGTIEDSEGLATSEMGGSAAETNMSQFDFSNTWNTVVGPDGYPVLEAIDKQTQLDAR